MVYLNKSLKILFLRLLEPSFYKIICKKEELIFIFLAVLGISFLSCSSKGINELNKAQENYKILEEVELINIPIKGELAERSSEISGMCWYGDKLIILPQYPSSFSDDYGKIFFIQKSSILSSISGNDSSLVPDYFTIDLGEFEHLFQIGSGFESITIKDDIAYFSIEHMNNGKTESLLVSGKVDSVRKTIILNKDSLTKDPTNLFIHNISDESILYYKSNIIPIYELFGKNINKNPSVSIFNLDLEFQKKIVFPNIEYRITDVTAVDQSGKFWAINYFYPGDNKKLNPAIDEIMLKQGIGKSHIKYDPVERLIQFEIKENSINLTDEPPIYISLLHNNSRNWEAIVKLDDRGFLIATDTFPETILAFVRQKFE